MIWYKDLYVGESIVHKTKKVKWKIMHNAGQIGIYVITLASNTQNLLDIIPSYEAANAFSPEPGYFLLCFHPSCNEPDADSTDTAVHETKEIGRASCRERVC